MDQLKPWQIVLMVAAVIVLVGSIAWSVVGKKSVTLTDSIMMADVTTGELFEFDTSGKRAVILPEKNPDTGKAALLPVWEDEDGRWFVSERYWSELDWIEGEPSKYDARTGQVEVGDATVQRLKAGG